MPTISGVRGNAMSVISLRDRRTMAKRRAAGGSAREGEALPAARLSRRRIWTALVLYCAAFWGMVGYAIYDIFGR
jgi:hypothetical protein